MTQTNTTTYLVTGGNRGIGFEIVKALSARDNVFVIATTRSASKQLDELAEKTGNIKALDLTVDDEQSVAEFGKALAKIENLSIDYFISNAGIAEVVAATHEVERDSWIRHWKINGLGPVEVYKVIRPYLNPTDSKLVFVSSIVGSISSFASLPVNTSAYGASKLFLNYVAKDISIEREGVSTVISLHPGVVSSDMGAAFTAQVSKVKPELDFSAFSISPEQSAGAQLKIIDGLTAKDTGKFLSYDGSEISW